MQASFLLRVLNNAIHAIDRILSVILGSLIFILAFGVMISVFLRYVFGISFAWAEELLTMSFVISTFLGAALGLREKEHISISLLQTKNKSVNTIISVVSMILLIIILAFVYHYSLIWIARVGGVPSPATGIRYAYFYALVPISFGISIFYAICTILEQFLPIEPPKTKSQFDSGNIEMTGKDCKRDGI
jgi:TRAP-type C4-dicarboxylate transport system permease small subunit